MTDDPSSRPTIKQETPDHDGPPTIAELAPLFPQLEVLEILGQGGMGIVYKARQRSLDRLVALKILPPDAGRNGSFTERFTREARALAKLQHPNIVMIHDSGEVKGLYYFVMEFVDGSDLRRMMRVEGRLSPQQALAIIPSICDALEYAHEEGLAHRDIKPENILLDKRGNVKIADFGIAKLLDGNPTSIAITGTSQMIGTMHYMSPEQIERPSQVDHRADIYSLGVVFYEMLTGELPIGRFDLPSQKVQLDVRIDDIVLRTLEKEPDRRYQNISDIRTQLDSIARAAPMVSTVEGSRQPLIAYLLWCGCFFAVHGLHRFYAGKFITGVLWLVTFGFFFIGSIVDLFLIPDMIRRANRKQMIKAMQRDAGTAPRRTSHTSPTATHASQGT